MPISMDGEDRVQQTPKWTWERTDPDRSGSSGDIAKLFRHEQQKAPGILAEDTPPPAATLLAREVIQNSWDAARELATELPDAPQFNITFRFQRVTGPEKGALVESADLSTLSQRVQDLDRQQIGLRSTDCLDELADLDEPLGILEILEEGATGMYGPWRQARSHMYLALVSLGYTEKVSGSGGSYGYGKAGLINGSRIRSVWAYTCFRPVDAEPGVSRRMLGMTYWGQHEHGDDNFTGFARFGEPVDGDLGVVKPFENDRADRVAATLGIGTRGPEDSSQLGTTFLLIDPTVDPKDLLRAIERSWWPALVDSDFYATVIDYDGNRLHPRPRRDPVLRTFIDAWEIAKGLSDPRSEADHLSEVTTSGRGARDGRPLGELGLVSDISGWSYADQASGPAEEPIMHRSLVALTRGPKMVVEYLEAGQSPPYVRGTFIADASVDDTLLRTEPKAHDAWRSKSEDGELDPGAAEVAGAIIKKVKAAVNNHRQRLKPPVPRAEDVVLPEFNDMMRRILSGTGQGVTPPPVADSRPVSIQLDYEPAMTTDGRIQVAGTVTFSLSEHSEDDEALVEVGVLYRFLEEDRVGGFAEITWEQLSGDAFREVEPGTFRGTLKRDGEVRFRFETAPYDPDWSGRLFANGSIVVAGSSSMVTP